MIRNYYLTGGYRFDVTKVFSYTPSVSIKWAGSLLPVADINLMLNYTSDFSIGLSYRALSTAAVLARIHLFKYIDVAYSYDFTLLRFGTSGLSTHEMMLIFKLCPKHESEGKRHYCPAYQ